ncbi:MAG: ornithine carbamoyltransferase [Deltaproteobacteria bacterium]|nr:ornithine carbamoyltransferase [Candidatus Anaeroferrophillus wilburensis]
MSRKNKDFLDLYSWPAGDLRDVLSLATVLKAERLPRRSRLAGRTLAMIFEKASTRTRVSFEVGMFQLGGQALFLSRHDTQLGRGEPIEDTARVLSRYVDGIMIRTFSQDDVVCLARHATVPVINGLTDLLHPSQVLADIFTIQERLGEIRSMKVAYIGDGNNMANSWIHGALRFGFDLTLACPAGYHPDSAIMALADKSHGSTIKVVADPLEAARDAQVINTDVWASMGQEEEAAARRQVFAPFQVNDALLAVADPAAMVLHCLPAHRGEEISAAVFSRFQELIFTQAENRLHVQKALLVRLLGGEDESR